MSNPNTISIGSGLMSSSFGLAILDALPNGADLTTKVVLVGLAGVLTTFLTTTTLEYLNKLKKMPEPEVFDRHVKLLQEVNESLGEFLAGHDEWKKSMEHRVSNLEDGKS